jgi:hypothetical protein
MIETTGGVSSAVIPTMVLEYGLKFGGEAESEARTR